MNLELDACWPSIASPKPKVDTCPNMSRSTFPYQICAAWAALVGGVVLVFAFGNLGSISGCTQNPSARAEAAVGAELEIESLSALVGNTSSSVRLSSSLAVPAPIPECGPDGSGQTLGVRAARPVRLTLQDDWETRSTDPPAFVRSELPSRFTFIEKFGDQRGSSFLSVSRAQGILEAVRSVVLRL